MIMQSIQCRLEVELAGKLRPLERLRASRSSTVHWALTPCVISDTEHTLSIIVYFSLYRACGLTRWRNTADVTCFSYSVFTAYVRLVIHTDRWHLLNMTAYHQMILACLWTALALCFFCYSTESLPVTTSVLSRGNWGNNLKWRSGNVPIFLHFLIRTCDGIGC